MEEFSRRPPFRWQPGSGGRPFVFFKTIAGPGSTDYPDKADSPTVYYARKLTGVTFGEIVGAPELSSTEVEGTEEFLRNLGDAYIEEGDIVLAWPINGRWFTSVGAGGETVEGILAGDLEPAATVTEPSTAQLNVWTDNPDGDGDIEDTGTTVTVTTRMTEHETIEAGTWLVARKINGEYRPIASDCGPSKLS